MITRAALAVAALLASAPLGSAAMAADWDRRGAAAHHRARAHHDHQMHHSHRMHRGHHMHHGHHAWTPGHRQVLYRNPAYRARWAQPRPAAMGGWHGHHRGYAAYRGAYVGPGYAYPRAVRYTYAQPVAGSYVGGGLIGALFNQPACPCR